jgi:phosphoribosyl 1,2-cyclic phosphodiesterase
MGRGLTMAIKFRSLCSGSGGNAALLWTDTSGVLIDFAPGCQRDCRRILREAKQAAGYLSAVLVTHAHGDHINRNSLKVLREEGLTVRCHPKVCRQIKERHGSEYAGIIQPFKDQVTIGDWTAVHVPVEHSPRCYTTALILTAASGGRRYKVSVFTDHSDFSEEHLSLAADSDLLCLEANHDMELLESYGHPGSEFHMSNIRTAEFLHGICMRGRRQPGAVVLGHLSEDCNRPHLPVQEIESFFGRNSTGLEFETHVSPRSAPGGLLTIR